MNYVGTALQDILRIDELFTIHYFEYTGDFFFPGESHDFWEFTFVDKGSVNICMDDEELILHRGEIAFHQPNEFHKVSTYGQISPNLVLVSFRCNSPLMDFFKQKVLKIDEKERSLLANILTDARKLFESPLDDPYIKEMIKRKSVPLGSEQFIRMHLEFFLLQLIQRHFLPENETNLPAIKSSIDIFKRAVGYMEENLSNRLTISQICRDNMTGRTQLQNAFQREANMGVIEYFSKMKIDRAKHLIGIGNLNFSQIAERLGYNSIHYFSRQFKQLTGMTPTEYSFSVEAMMEKEP